MVANANAIGWRQHLRLGDRMVRRAAAVAVVWLLAAGGALAAEPAAVAARLGGIDLLGRAPHYVDFGLGVFDIRAPFNASKTSAAGRVEARGGEKLWGLGPAVGLMVNADGGIFGYGAIYADLAYGNFVVTPLAGLGGYSRDDSSDLGGVFQFRLSLGLNYQFADQSRLGLNIAHISNAGIHDNNPGEEEVYVTYAIPF